jgi:hypothetical protein
LIMPVQIPFIGGAYTNNSPRINCQKSVNCYPVIDNKEAKNILSMAGTPGLQFFTKISSYGSGANGAATISVDTTLTKDMEYTNLTINSGITLDTGGYTVMCSGTLTNNGTITNAASGGSGGVGGVGYGIAAANLGGSGGDPLIAGAGVGGDGGNGGGSTSTGGAGGQGGGFVNIFARTFTNNGLIQVNGSNAGSPTNDGTGSGIGGNGGNGGTASLFYDSKTTGTVTANGGSRSVGTTVPIDLFQYASDADIQAAYVVGGVSLDSYTKLMLHMDSDFSDSSASSHTPTVVGATIDTSQKVFGIGSGNFNPAVSDQYVSYPDSADWYFGTGAFSIDFRIRYATVDANTQGLCGQDGLTAGNDWRITNERFLSGGQYYEKYVFYHDWGGVVQASYYYTMLADSGVWHHIEWGRSGANVYLLIDGMSKTLTTVKAISTNQMHDIGSVLKIGKIHSHALNGNLEEFRISKGIIRHTSSFTIPTTQYPLVPIVTSESLITTFGKYSGKVSVQQGCANATLTLSLSPTFNLVGVDTVSFSLYNTITGSNVTVGLHDSGGTTTSVTPSIMSSDAWQTCTIDLTSIASADKNTIDSLIITIANADVSSVFYISNMFYTYTTPALATSSTSLLIEAASKSFTTQAGLSYQVGNGVLISDTADNNNWMAGTITSYSSTTMVVSVAQTYGSGTFTSWQIEELYQANVNGLAGVTGAATWTNIPYFSFTSGDFRGGGVFNNKLYVVIANQVLCITTAGVTSSLGTLTTSTGFVSMDSNGTQLLIVDGTAHGYYVTLSTNILTAINDADFPAAGSCCFLDGFLIVTKVSTGQFYISGLYDVTSWDALDYATAEGSPDNLLCCGATQEALWLFGTDTTEVWYNQGGSDFPFARMQGALIEQGIGALASLCSVEGQWYLINDNKEIVRSVGYQFQKVSTIHIDKELQSYSTVSDAVAYEYRNLGQIFVVFVFPTANKTWVYDLVTDYWHEWSSYVNPGVLNNFGRHRGAIGFHFNGKYIVGDYSNGSIYILNNQVYTDNGELIKRTRRAQIISDKGVNIIHDEICLEFEAGVGLSGTGSGSNPQVGLSFSDDDGNTWSSVDYRYLGTAGSKQQRQRWLRLGKARNRIYELTMYEPVKFILANVTARFEELSA